MSMSLTQLRANLYQIVDEIIKTGKPVEIKRHGQLVKIVSIKPTQGKLARLEKHPGTIIGDPDEIIHIDWSKNWNEIKNL